MSYHTAIGVLTPLGRHVDIATALERRLPKIRIDAEPEPVSAS